MTTRSEIELLVQFSCLCGVGVCKVCDNLRSGIDRVLADRDARIAVLEKALKAAPCGQDGFDNPTWDCGEIHCLRCAALAPEKPHE